MDIGDKAIVGSVILVVLVLIASITVNYWKEIEAYVVGLSGPSTSDLEIELMREINSEKEERVRLETQIAELSRISEELQEVNRLHNEQELDTSYSVTDILNTWRPVSAHIVCDYESYYGTGSGTLVDYPDGSVIVVTNQHVILDDFGYAPDYCGIFLPESSTPLIVYSEDMFTSFDGTDWGYLEIEESSIDLLLYEVIDREDRYYCTDLMVGDEVIILGYPSIGDVDDVTVTSGLISGLDEDFYITDAKIEAGNSGGAAISRNGNCIFGIPTATQAGNYESLGRILDIGLVFE
ncbi:MAG: trypsin-like peptidase domain-containing protein [bacterium]|nr:trypsin-like peptidase domain-containing protein [bacterium]MDA1024640.1 trypsin-like peptidase domain-containing protein [bacterium]